MSTLTYEATLKSSQKSNWKIEDIIGGDKVLDFSKPFLPEALARTEPLDFLSRDERRLLNQIRGHAYLSLFIVVEEFILPFVLDHTRADLGSDDWRTRSLLQFAGEEAKHQQLFKRFRGEFARGFGVTCDVIGPPEEIAKAVLAHDPLGVALVILQAEWMTQRHYLDSVRDDEQLDPQFKSLLRYHWIEEAQHAKLDTLMVESIAAERDGIAIAKAVDEYLAIGGILDAGLKQQVQFDLDAFQRASGRTLSAAERDRFTSVQLQANRWTYLGSGMSHPEFLRTVGRLAPDQRARLAEIAPSFS